MMIAERIAPNQTLVPVATGKAEQGGEYTVTVSPDYGPYMDYLAGRDYYRKCLAIEICINDDMRRGWRDEEDWVKGQAAYLRALEDEGCPAEWADPYVRSDAWYDRQMLGEIPF